MTMPSKSQTTNNSPTNTDSTDELRDFLWSSGMFDKLNHDDHLALQSFINARVAEAETKTRLNSEHYWIKYYGGQRTFLDGSDGDMPQINELKRHQ